MANYLPALALVFVISAIALSTRREKDEDEDGNAKTVIAFPWWSAALVTLIIGFILGWFAAWSLQ